MTGHDGLLAWLLPMPLPHEEPREAACQACGGILERDQYEVCGEACFLELGEVGELVPIEQPGVVQ